MLEVMMIAKALADESRVRAVFALKDRELCVCQIIELLGLAPSTVSKHMTILKQARLVECRRKGRWTYYRLAGEDASPEVRDALAWICASAASTPTIQQDVKQLKEILKLNPEELCRRQCAA